MQQSIERQTLTQQVTTLLREDILLNRIPAGARITVQTIAERYNTSPLPVREAFRTLASEKLIELSPYKGATVCPVDRTFCENAYEILKMLEVIAMEAAIYHWTPALHTKLAAINEEMKLLDSPEKTAKHYHRLNRSFHDPIEAFCHNEQAKDLLAHYRHLVWTVSQISAFESTRRVEEATAEHDAILDALSRRDIRACRNLYMEHAEKARSQVIDTIFG